MILHGYWRSGAAYRVRIALGLKGIGFSTVPHDLRTGAQKAPDYMALNPQGMVPALEADGQVIVQSVAILEWLEETHPQPPLLPAGAADRAQVRAMVGIVASDIHPLNNLRVVRSLREDYGQDQAGVDAWAARWMRPGFDALQAMIARVGGDWSFGDRPSLADCCLVPQLYSAHRYNVDLTPWPRLRAIEARAAEHPAFAAAHPDRQPDADL